MIIFLGLNSDVCRRLPKMNATQQVSFMSVNRPEASVSPCVIPPCSGYQDCHHHLPKRIEIPFGTSMPNLDCKSNQSQSIKEPSVGPITKLTTKSTTESTTEPSAELSLALGLLHSETCQCSPEKMKELLEHVLKGKPFNLNSMGCDVPTKQVTIISEKREEQVESDSGEYNF